MRVRAREIHRTVLVDMNLRTTKKHLLKLSPGDVTDASRRLTHKRSVTARKLAYTFTHIDKPMSGWQALSSLSLRPIYNLSQPDHSLPHETQTDKPQRRVLAVKDFF